MKILYITNVPSPYRVDYFNELGKYCDLTVLFEKNTSDERDSSWLNYKFKNFKGVFLKGHSYKTDGAICFDVVKHLKNNTYEKIICTNFTSPTGMLAIEYMRRKKIKYYLESDGGFAKNGKGFKEWLKKRYISGADGYFSTGATHDKYYLAYGAEPNKIYRYPFTSLKEKDILTSVPSAEEKAKIRAELSLPEKRIILSVGQFIYRKGFDVLIKAAKNFPENCGVYIVGGQPAEEYISLKEELGLTNIHFAGFKLKEELKKYYMAADLFVLPTREDIWGLVINEAMSMGLPVITTDKCIAGLELIENGVNGYIIPVDDEKAMAEKINYILKENLSLSFGIKSLEKNSGHTIEKMAEVHINVFGGVGN